MYSFSTAYAAAKRILICGTAILLCIGAPGAATAAERAIENVAPAASDEAGSSVSAQNAPSPAAESVSKGAGDSARKQSKTSAKKQPAKKVSAKTAAKSSGKTGGAKKASSRQPASTRTTAAKESGKNSNAAATVQKAETPKGFPASKAPVASTAPVRVADTWRPLKLRLAKDGIEIEYLRGLFGRLGDSYSHVPMGVKINELFTYKFMPTPPRTKKKTPSDSPPVYKRMVTPENIEKCKDYLTKYSKTFVAMEAEYGVPKEVVAGLLMVETRLGTYLGVDSSFWSLACLAAADSPDRVEVTVQNLPLPMTSDKEEWLKKILRERSAWAYKELLALIKHSQDNGLDPLVMPGSVYGAIGICQFMPSNLPKFAVDGDKDGRIDLFNPADAIPSVGNYLKRHGWQGTERSVHHAALKRYNKSNVYANTILAIADGISGPQEASGAVAAAEKKKSVKNTAAASGKKNTTQKKRAAKGGKPAAKKPAKQAHKKTSEKSDAAKPAQAFQKQEAKTSAAGV